MGIIILVYICRPKCVSAFVCIIREKEKKS